MAAEWLEMSAEVRDALSAGRPVVALESTLIAHGLPWPTNRDTAFASEAAVREAGAVPATIAVWKGKPTVGLGGELVEELAKATGVLKASRRDLATAIAQQRTAATTVAATMFLAHAAGIRVFATGGIGGAHRGEQPFDISADLSELARTPVLVVSAGAKSILDLPRTLEILETLSVPVVGYRTDRFPAFYVRDSGLPVSATAASSADAASLFHVNCQLGNAGMLLAKPLPDEVALNIEVFNSALEEAERLAKERSIQGSALTPFLLARLAELTNGKSLIANQALIVANARLAAEVAVELSRL